MRTLQDSVDLRFPCESCLKFPFIAGSYDFKVGQCNEEFFVRVCQSSIGPLAISSVIWDAGLYLVDFLIHSWEAQHMKSMENDNESLDFLIFGDHILDLGCGTGLAGIAALILGAKYVLFSDASSTWLVETNLEDFRRLNLPNAGVSSLLEYDWKDVLTKDVPVKLIYPQHLNTEQDNDGGGGGGGGGEGGVTWDTVFCSDVLYDSAMHHPLLLVLKHLRFRKVIISYKKRHEAEERKFFDALSEWCNLSVIVPTGLRCRNISPSALHGLYLVMATPI